jgi:peptidyl-prolyl cis-trans isomerase SDCCAG10
LNNKNTIFGKVVGDTVYNMLRLNDLEVSLWAVRQGAC